jgi:hypothetical protein
MSYVGVLGTYLCSVSGVEHLNYPVTGDLLVEKLREIVEQVKMVLEAITRGEYCCLRHGLPYITPSLLASQAFCEYKLELQLASGDLEKPKVSDAAKLVEAILQVKRLIPDRPPASGRLSLSIPLAAIVDDVAIVGRPHAMLFSSQGLEAIVIGKLTSKPDKVFLSDRVRMYTYALLAESAGFKIPAHAKLVLVSAKKPKELAEALKTLENNGLRAGRVGEAYIHVLAHDPLLEREIISRLLAYWKGLRNPEKRVGPWCQKCPYHEVCRQL